MSRKILKIRPFLKATPQLILTPLMVVGMAALILYLLGQAPGYFQGERNGFREFKSIEGVESYLGFKLILPKYFPSYLSWPPSRIYGAREPLPVAQTVFLTHQGDYQTLLIYQIDTDSEDLPVPLPWVTTLHKKTPITIGDSDGFMITGRGANGELLNGAYWKTKDFYFVVITTRSEPELLTIARSM